MTWLIAALALASSCAAPPPPPPPPAVSFEQKMAWILELEDRRILRIELPPAVPVITRGRTSVPPPPPSAEPDLTTLAGDGDARVRRRAALALGRVGLADGAAPLVARLADTDSDVRQMAAFGLALLGVALGDPSEQTPPALAPAVAPLAAALADPEPGVRGRAAMALGHLRAREHAAAIGRVAAEYARSAPVAALAPDDETWPAAPEADACKLALVSLVRLRNYEALAGAVLGSDGRPVSTWWPVAYALQRVDDKRAIPALRQLLRTPGRYTAAFAARGLGTAGDAGSADALLDMLESARDRREVFVAVIRALAQLEVARAAPPLITLASDSSVDPNIRLEAVTALGLLRAGDALPIVQDLLTDPWPTMRAAAMRAAAAIDRDSFLLVLAGLDRDPQWSVRAALAGVLATFPAETVGNRVRAMLSDEDKRVIPAVLGALARMKPPDLEALLLARIKDPDFAVRAAAATHLRDMRTPAGADALRQAYKTGEADSAYAARANALAALTAYGAAEAIDTLTAALADKDWAVRVRAAELLTTLSPGGDHRMAIRPAPTATTATYDDPQLISPQYSPHAFIETAKGTIEIELAVLDAPQTARNFTTLARKGFFNGLSIHRVVPNFVVQDGDPRGDGQGSPGYTIRDELNDRPYLRGTVGMALAWRDTGGSQFFIAHSPQPHLDALYTVFGHVVNGMDVVDRLQQGDVIERVRIWDGKTMQ